MARPRTGKTPLRNIRVPDALWQAAKARAASEGRTITDVILAALHRYVSAREREPSGPPTGEQEGR